MHRSKNSRLGSVLLAISAGMVGMAYAAVPLYQIFCQITGYGGTTQAFAAEAAEEIVVLERKMRVRFTGNVTPGLNWDFDPRQTIQEVQIGARALAYYDATNQSSNRRITGTATFNVTPHKAGVYFTKVECFCFTEQVLEPGESAEMPVTYFIDPAIADDPNLDEVTEVTLSYTFFLAGSEEVADAGEHVNKESAKGGE